MAAKVGRKNMVALVGRGNFWQPSRPGIFIFILSVPDNTFRYCVVEVDFFVVGTTASFNRSLPRGTFSHDLPLCVICRRCFVCRKSFPFLPVIHLFSFCATNPREKLWGSHPERTPQNHAWSGRRDMYEEKHTMAGKPVCRAQCVGCLS